MRSRALSIAFALAALAAFAGCQIVGGIEDRPYVRDAGAPAVTDDAGQSGFVDPKDASLVTCAPGACTHEIGAGAAFTCARNADARVRCWGANDRGQLGDNTIEDRKDPVFVSEVDGATDVWAGADHACARLADGRASCWGSNVSGELGDPEFTAFYRARGAVLPGLERVTELALGDGHTCALRDGNVLCWGANTWGQAGKSGLADKVESPTAVTGLRSGADDVVVAVAAGGWSTCALKDDGSVMCWGNNDAGELANGSRAASAAPARVEGLAAAKHIGMSRERACAVLRDGTVWCWGGASDRDAGPPPSPSKVEGVERAVQVAVGDEHTCARLDDGTMSCWGYDLHGQLGRGRNDGGAPGLVNALTNVTSFALGPSHSCAKSSGAFYCWGANAKGQLGDGSTTDQYVATKVLTP